MVIMIRCRQPNYSQLSYLELAKLLKSLKLNWSLDTDCLSYLLLQCYTPADYLSSVD